MLILPNSDQSITHPMSRPYMHTSEAKGKNQSSLCAEFQIRICDPIDFSSYPRLGLCCVLYTHFLCFQTSNSFIHSFINSFIHSFRNCARRVRSIYLKRSVCSSELTSESSSAPSRPAKPQN